MSEAPAAAESEADGAGASDAPLVVVDPDPEGRRKAESLAEALGRRVWALDPAELGCHSFDELGESRAVVLAWDLGGVVALDLLEDLRGDPRTEAVPVALATPAPTRDLVLTSLRWGAATVLHQPLDAGEIARRLGLGDPGEAGGGGEDAEAAAGSGPEGDGDGPAEDPS